MRITEQVARKESSTCGFVRPAPAAPTVRADGGRVARLLELQRTVGNAFVRRLIQCKLAVSRPGDAFEQEADRVAETAMSVTNRAPAAGQLDREEEPAPAIRRMCAGCEQEVGRAPVSEEEKEESAVMRVQRQATPEEDEEMKVARASGGDVEEVDGAVEAGIRNLPGSGSPLEPAARTDMESRLGFDFSGVRVHTDSSATQLARSVNALAFTVGSDVVFGGGQYRPDTQDGKRLLAHELTHVVQQTGGTERRDAERPGEGTR
jgi:hypothetical protein